MVNYKHLHYFWVVAREGSIAAASERLHITPQTISGQLSLLEAYYGVALFNKSGRNLKLSVMGQKVLSYADDIFSLGNELDQMMQAQSNFQLQVFKVGVVDVVPKLITHQILLPALKSETATRVVCREADLEGLLADLALHRLDLVIADRPITATFSSRGYSHELGKSPICFLCTGGIKATLKGEFPSCLHGAPMLLPTNGSQLRSDIDLWLNQNRINPVIVAEFDDSALMKAFAQEGIGTLIVPSVISEAVMRQYALEMIGQTDEVSQTFYGISVEKKISNQTVASVIEAASTVLFSKAPQILK